MLYLASKLVAAVGGSVDFVACCPQLADGFQTAVLLTPQLLGQLLA